MPHFTLKILIFIVNQNTGTNFQQQQKKKKKNPTGLYSQIIFKINFYATINNYNFLFLTWHVSYHIIHDLLPRD